MKRIAFFTLLVYTLAACHNEQGHELLGCGHDHSHDTKHSHSHSHDHDHDHDHNHDHNHDHELYGVIHLHQIAFGDVIKAGGEILPAQGDEQVIVANHDGLVFFGKIGMQQGVPVSANQQLMTIKSGGLVHDNLEVGYLEAKAQAEKAKADFDRASNLMADTIISESQFLDAKLNYEKSRLAYENIKKNYQEGGQKVSAPVNGFVKAIHVTEGEFVQTGQPLATISQNRRLVIKAEVPQDMLPKLPSLRSANFITPYDGKLYSTTELNGTLISWGKSTYQGSFYIPIFFEVDNRDGLFPGTYIEVYLKAASGAQSIAIPQSALLEEYGSHYVYVDNHDGFEKRYVTIDGTDGNLVRITQGLKAGEHIATKNVSRIKLSQMSGQLPEHAHVH